MSVTKHVFGGFNKFDESSPYVCMTYCGQHFSLDQRHRHMVDKEAAILSTCDECDAALVLKMLADLP